MFINKISDKYIAFILSEVKSSQRQLYPLTKSYPLCLLPIVNKKLIIYQLEALSKVQNLQKIVIVTSAENNITQLFIEREFLVLHPNYLPKIEFIRSSQSQNTFVSLQQSLKSLQYSYKGYITLLCDTISSIGVDRLIEYHESKGNDLSMLLKPKKEYGEAEQKKIPQGQLQTEIDNILIGERDEILFMDMADEIDSNGVKIDPSIYQRVKRASFRKVVDSKIYIFSHHLVQIIKNLGFDEIYDIKPWLIQLIVHNQTNKRFIGLDKSLNQSQFKALKISAYLTEQDTYIRKINSKKIYELLNFDGLIRGQKQKDILLPTAFNDPLDDRKDLKGVASIAENALIGPSCKIRRACIGSHCKIGKNVEILNSIILDNVEIKDGCKINESVIGSNTTIGQGANIKNSYFSMNCRVADGSKIEGQTIIFSL